MPQKIHASKVYADSIDHVTALITAQVPVIWVVTYEEHRFIEELTRSTKLGNHKIWYWSATSGLVSSSEDFKHALPCSGPLDGTKPAPKALEKIHEYNIGKGGNLVAIMRDFHIALQDSTARQIRDIYEQLANDGKTILIVSPYLAHVGGGGIHPLLEKQVVVVDFTLPTHEQIVEHIKGILGVSKTDSKKASELNYSEEQFREIARALQGLSITEIDNAVATSLAHLNKLDAEVLLQEKKQLVRKSQILEFIDTEIEQGDVGGLDLAKTFLTRYADRSKEAEAFGVEPLKGVIFTGVPGTGKSLLCKATSHLWKLPCLRLDIGRVMGKLVGQSEDQMRQAINTAEAMAPCILWIDEVEKSLSGTKSSNFSDGGTLSRVFGTLLTAMQEGMKGVTVIATANDITALPPEFIRRFNEVFFVDLPGPDERWEIFEIHLSKRNRDIKKFSGAKKEILNACDGYTGAEIEKAIKDAVAMAYYDKEKDVKVGHILQALNETKPISRVQGEKIAEMQSWAASHARFASSFSEAKLKNIKDKTEVKDIDMSSISAGLDSIKTPAEKKAEVLANPTGDRFSKVKS